MLERLELDDIESNTISHASNTKVGPQDTLVKDSITELNLSDNFRVQIRETLKFRPPKAP